MGEAQEKKVAYHRLLLEDGTMVNGPLVVVYHGGVMHTFYPLDREEASVIWRGGVGTPRI
jgi:hypothetical protein